MTTKNPKNPGPLFKGAPNKQPRGRRRFSTGEFEGLRSGALRRAAGPKSASDIDVPGAKGTKLTRKTRKGLMAAIHAEAEAEGARTRDVASTAQVRDLRRINHARSQPFGPPTEQIEAPPVLVLTPEQQAIQRQHHDAYLAAQQTADENLRPYNLRIKTTFRNPKRLKPRDLYKPDGRGEVRILDGAGNETVVKPGRQRRRGRLESESATATAEMMGRIQRERTWKRRERELAARGVSAEDRELLRLIEREDLKPGEAAANLKLRPEVVRKRLQRLRDKLKP